MRKVSIRALAVLCCVALVFAATTVLACSQEKDDIVVGVRTDIPGFSSIDRDAGEPEGYEVDVASEVVRRVTDGKGRAVFVGVSGGTRENLLDTGSVDLVVACYTRTDERAARYALSPAYYTDGVEVLVADGSGIEDAGSLSGRTVGVLAGSSTGETVRAWAASQGIDVFVNDGFSSYEEIASELRAGLIDGFASDRSILGAYDGYGFSTVEIPDTPQEYVIASRLDDGELAEKVAAAVQDMQEDGTLASLQARWGLG